jgi:hypothetical protein
MGCLQGDSAHGLEQNVTWRRTQSITRPAVWQDAEKLDFRTIFSVRAETAKRLTFGDWCCIQDGGRDFASSFTPRSGSRHCWQDLRESNKIVGGAYRSGASRHGSSARYCARRAGRGLPKGGLLPSFGTKLFMLAQASISVPSTEKCLLESRLRTCGRFKTLAHISRETRDWLATRPAGRFHFTFTPKHGSWLNLVEGFFSKFARSVLRHIRVKARTQGTHYGRHRRRQPPSSHPHPSYKLAEAA